MDRLWSLLSIGLILLLVVGVITSNTWIRWVSRWLSSGPPLSIGLAQTHHPLMGSELGLIEPASKPTAGPLEEWYNGMFAHPTQSVYEPSWKERRSGSHFPGSAE